MSDSHTVVTSRSWFQRMGSSFSGFLIGIVLFFGSFFLLSWNEGRSIREFHKLKEGERAVVSVPSTGVDTKNEGHLIHTTGVAMTSERLADPEFGVGDVALRFRRVVEMYQWEESSRSETREKLGGRQETVTTYEYRKVWSERPIRSANFNKPAGHENPDSFPHQPLELAAREARLGAFALGSDIIKRIDVFEKIPILRETLAGAPAKEVVPAPAVAPALPEATRPLAPAPAPQLTLSLAPPEPAAEPETATPPTTLTPAPTPTPAPAPLVIGGRVATVLDGVLYLPKGESIDTPTIGDVRIRFEKVPPTEISIVARQHGNALIPWPTKTGGQIYLVQVGLASAPEMFATARAANQMFTWLLRLAGFLAMLLGLNLIAGPLSTFAAVIPFLGRVVGFATGLVALFIAGALSLITIAIAWIAHRPMLAIPLVALAILALLYGFKLWRGKKAPAPATR